MEEVTRIFARIAAITFFFSSAISICYADPCYSPRIKRAKSCGIVTDPYGMRIPNAKIEFGPAGTNSSAVTDIHGKFSLAAEGREVRMQIAAPGFQPVETSIGRLKPASDACKKPLLVMLTIDAQGCAMVSMRKSELLLAKKD